MATNTNVIKFPQRRLAGGFTQIPNDLLAACISPTLRGSKAAVLLAVARLTLGWGVDKAKIKLSDIAEMAKMSKSRVSEVLKELEAMGALDVVYTRTGRMIGIIDDYAALCSENPKPEVRTVSENPNPEVRDSRTLSKYSNKYINNPPVVPQKPEEALTGPADADASAPLAPSSVKRKKLQTLDEYAAACKAAGVKLIPETDPVFAFADRVGIPRDWLYLCWREFARRNREQGKRQRDWPQTFRNCVRSNWYGLWKVARDGSVFLTSEGELIRREVEAQEESV